MNAEKINITQPITGCIITKNNEASITKCVMSLKPFCSSILVLDSGSTDKTCDLARKLDCIVMTQPFLGFGPQKNKCLKFAQTDWVFFLDSDEVVSEQLATEIMRLDLHKKNVSYRVRRINFIGDNQIKFSGWQTDFVTRLFNKKVTRFLPLMVHESVANTENLEQLNGFIYHQPYRTPDELIKKAVRYGLIGFSQRSKRLNNKSNCWKATIKGYWSFLRTYLLRLGILDGYYGYRIATANRIHTVIKYRGYFRKKG